MQPFIWFFTILMLMVLFVGPTIGGAMVWQSLKIARVSDVTFGRCWKSYLAACCYAALVMFVMLFFLHDQLPWLRTLLFFLTPLVVVPILIRNHSKPALLAEIVAIVVANVIILLIFWMLSTTITKDQEPAPGRFRTLRERALLRMPAKPTGDQQNLIHHIDG